MKCIKLHEVGGVNTVFRGFKQKLCLHNYVDIGMTTDLENNLLLHRVYCPKCHHEMNVDTAEIDLIMARQKAYRDYKYDR